MFFEVSVFDVPGFNDSSPGREMSPMFNRPQ